MSLRGWGREVSVEKARVPFGGRLREEIQPRPPSRLPEGQPCVHYMVMVSIRGKATLLDVT